MTGLDLEDFLLLLRTDLTTWVVLALASLGLVGLVWSSWRSRRALRNSLVLSLAGHLGLVLYGSTIPAVIWTSTADRRDALDRSHIRQIRVAPLRESSAGILGARPGDSSQVRPGADRWDLTVAPLKPGDASLKVTRPKLGEQSQPILNSKIDFTPLAPDVRIAPQRQVPSATVPESRPELASNELLNAPLTESPPLPPTAEEMGPSEPKTSNPGNESAKVANEASRPTSRNDHPILGIDRRLRPDRIVPMRPDAGAGRIAVDRRPEPNAQPTVTTQRPGVTSNKIGEEKKVPTSRSGMLEAGAPIPLVPATPDAAKNNAVGPGLAKLSDRAGVPSLLEIPKIYQPRLERDRSTRAQRIGASAASEMAVERALDWLSRHQDADGRWDAGTARYEDGVSVKGDDDYTAHCPPGDICVGVCAYWEADTALTGLALLTFLGAGYTQSDGRYAEVVGKGLDFLIHEQKPDGDLRGRSDVVGMYCHAMATLAICEAFALTSDSRLRAPAERAIAFLVRSRARDGMAWRYVPSAPVGDTSILGWVVMGLKSAKEVGIAIPNEPDVRRGILLWLDKVATGSSQGLARYQPWEPVTPTMTAEAWVCRQFLGAGGPGASSSEAAEFLLRNDSDRGDTNVYYWYYATLALYQHGGEPWIKWNAKIRDKIIALQSRAGHQTGSWPPDTSIYGARGGRIYCTTLAALSLEVYYRYLRLYDEPKIPLDARATPDRRPD